MGDILACTKWVNSKVRNTKEITLNSARSDCSWNRRFKIKGRVTLSDRHEGGGDICVAGGEMVSE